MLVHLKTLGCRLNEAELETWSRDFHAHGHRMTAQVENADLVVINTCAVTEEAVKKSRKLLRKAQRQNPQAKLVVSGCYASLDADGTRAIEGVDLIIPNTDKNRLVESLHCPTALSALLRKIPVNCCSADVSGRSSKFRMAAATVAPTAL